jgi:putative flippase GtrA
VIERVRDNLSSAFCVIDESKLGPRLKNETGAWRPIAMRWLKFNAVGALGIAVQLAVLLGLKTGLHLSYLLATALAVEAAVVHNFLWHERYTWADRVQPSWRRSLPRFLRFNLTTGGVSIAGNLALMKVMVGLGHLNYLVANSVAIALCSLVNFLVSEGWVFEKARKDRAKKCRVELAVRRE